MLHLPQIAARTKNPTVCPLIGAAVKYWNDVIQFQIFRGTTIKCHFLYVETVVDERMRQAGTQLNLSEMKRDGPGYVGIGRW
jgi:hypothetical protein